MTDQPPDFQVSTSVGPGSVCLKCTGELDLSSISQLEDGVSAALEQRTPQLVIDMRNVTFIDSTGVRIVWQAAQRCASRSISIGIIPSEPVTKLFELLQLDLPIAEPETGPVSP